MKGIVDRIEGKYIVVELENEEIINIEKDKSNCRISEGDVVDIINEKDNKIKIRKNKIETENRKKYIEDLVKDMWE